MNNQAHPALKNSGEGTTIRTRETIIPCVLGNSEFSDRLLNNRYLRYKA